MVRFRTRRRGVTLVELLVVIAIAGLLLALVLPAIQSARGQVRTAVCAEKLRTLSLAMQLHRDSKGALPVAFTHDSIWVSALPFLDGTPNSPVHVSVKLSEGTSIMVDSRVTYPASPAFQCPWWPGDQRPGFPHDLLPGIPPGMVSDDEPKHRDSYVGNVGSIADPNAQPGDGAFTSRGVRYRDIADGLSKTALLSEITITQQGHDSLKLDSETLATLTSISSERDFVERCRNLRTGDSDSFDALGATWTDSKFGQSTIYSHTLPPGSVSCLGTTGVTSGRLSWLMSAGSLHGGMVNVVMCDGSLAPTSFNVDAAVWRAMGTRSGGEVF